MSGNVSLYNETDGSGILPTPTIGAVGIMKADELIAGQPADGDIVVVIGETRGHLGQSALLAEFPARSAASEERDSNRQSQPAQAVSRSRTGDSMEVAKLMLRRCHYA